MQAVKLQPVCDATYLAFFNEVLRGDAEVFSFLSFFATAVVTSCGAVEVLLVVSLATINKKSTNKIHGWFVIEERFIVIHAI